ATPIEFFDPIGSWKPKDMQMFVTLWPSFEHFPRFAHDSRLLGIRLNSAMVAAADVKSELDKAKAVGGKVPLYFDVKSRQMRIAKVYDDPK
ncbi:hypothetical protein ACE400_29250, partial [Salmonella enterica]|uniref:hypothetical protein n=1 Tax=Salmonella enterica TaxID=28901 RepID=UPI003D29F280